MKSQLFYIYNLTLTCLIFAYSQIGLSQKILDGDNFVTITKDITQRAITSIFKDTEGYMWIATYGDGLFKYDSNSFKNYKKDWSSNDNNLSNSIIHSTFQDKEQNIWVGTEEGLNVYDKYLDEFNEIKFTNKNAANNFAIHAISEYDDHSLLIGTHQKGLYKLDKKTFKVTMIPYEGNRPLNNLLINAIVKSPNGRFLIGTNYGLMTFDPFSEALQMAKFNTETGYDVIDFHIESMIVTSDNSVWLGTFSSGLVKINENERGLFFIYQYKITEKRILSLSERSGSNILCGTENDGLFDLDFQVNSIKNYPFDKANQNGIKSNSIWTLYTDEKDRIWVGYYNNGVDVNDDNYNKFNAIKSIPSKSNSLNSSSVTGMVIDEKGRFWISMSNGGVDVYNPTDETFVNLLNKNNIAQGLTSLDIPTVFIDSRNNVWIGSWDSGIFLLKENSRNFINIKTANSKLNSNRVMSFAEDSRGTVWIGTFLSGLYSYDLNSGQLEHHTSDEFNKYNINTSNIRKVLVDKNDNVWIGTRKGLFKIVQNNKQNYIITPFRDKISLVTGDLSTQNIVYSLYQDSFDNLWIGTFGKGLFKYNTNDDSIKWFNSKNDLIHETIFSIIQEYSGDLWIAGNEGLTKFNYNTESFLNFTKKDGLLSNNFNFNSALKTSSNKLFFGNSKGINYFEPNKIIYNQEKPRVYLTSLKIANEIVLPTTDNSPLKAIISKSSRIYLNNNQSSFGIGFVGINYTRSENNQYSYFLEGFDKDWSVSEYDRVANYKNVPPGNYTFRVKASNNDGIWNNIPATIEIKILPSWWLTNFAYFIYVLLLMIIGIIISKFIRERIQEKHILNMERQEYKQFEALNAKKIQFFTNISHEFRTPLTLILSPLEEIIQEKDFQFSNEIKEKHNIIYKNAKRLSRLINELMDFRKLQFNKMSINASAINLISFVEEVVSHFEEEALSKNIILSIDFTEEEIEIWSDPTMLEKIIFNLMSNAFKAIVNDDGFITVTISKPSSKMLLPLVDELNPVPVVELRIKDNGLGIKKENISKVFDRFYQVNEMDNQYYGGTGIGLELVRNFVDLHKGKIELSSEINNGSEFKLYFPLGYSHLTEFNHQKHQKTEKIQSSEIKKNDIKNSELFNKTNISNKKLILIVEDNFELRTYLKNELKQEYYIKESENGLEALEKANKFLPDIIITDVMMPIMDGFEFCERLKSDIRTSHIPLLMITAKGMQIDKVKGIDSGADVYLNKPFNMNVLKSHLKQLINSRKILIDKYFKGPNMNFQMDNATSIDKEFITKVLSFINDNISNDKLNVENLAGELLLSRSKLYRKIKALTGDTANEFIRKIRLENAKRLIENSELTISEICYKVGFSSPSYFTKCFRDHFNILPTELRDKNIGKFKDINLT